MNLSQSAMRVSLGISQIRSLEPGDAWRHQFLGRAVTERCEGEKTKGFDVEKKTRRRPRGPLVKYFLAGDGVEGTVDLDGIRKSPA